MKATPKGVKGMKLWMIFSLSLLGILLLSCEQAQKPAAQVPKAPSKPVAVQSSPQEAEKPAVKMDDVFAIKSKQFDYTYNPIQKRDIFKPYEGEVTYFEEREKTPLERYDLSQMQLTAIIWGISEPRALVKAPDGQDYIVKRDMRMGRNNGRIARITKDGVTVAEEYRDPLGKLIVKETSLSIKKDLDIDALMLEME